MPSILFVCLGNTCRSPISEDTSGRPCPRRPKLALHVGSAGTGNWHPCAPPDLANPPILANIRRMSAPRPSAPVSATEFQTRAGLYIEQSAKAPVFITKHRRLARVLIDIAEYERLKARDTRQAHRTEALPDPWADALAEADYGPADPALEGLTE